MELPWIRLAVDFAVLDIFCPDLLQYVFGEKFLKQFLSRGNTCYGLLRHFHICMSHKIYKFHPHSNVYLPPCMHHDPSCVIFGGVAGKC